RGGVEEDQQRGLVLARREGGEPARQVGAEVERGPRGRLDPAVRPVLRGAGRRLLDAEQTGGEGVLGDHLLDRFGGALGQREPGAQHLVPEQHVAGGGGQGRAVQGTGDPQRPGDVVGVGARVHAVQQPQPALLGGERRGGGGAGAAGQVRAGGRGPVSAGGRGTGGDAGREAGDGGRLAQVAGADAQAEAGAPPGGRGRGGHAPAEGTPSTSAALAHISRAVSPQGSPPAAPAASAAPSAAGPSSSRAPEEPRAGASREGRKAPRPAGAPLRAVVGDGRALRSILRFSVSGNASSATNAEGTM